jgi:hypothetical protein
MRVNSIHLGLIDTPMAEATRWPDTTSALQVLERDGKGLLSAHGDALGVRLLVAGLSQRFPWSCQVGGAHGPARPSAGNTGPAQRRQGRFDRAGDDGGGPRGSAQYHDEAEGGEWAPEGEDGYALGLRSSAEQPRAG